jgi:predicted RNA binding protein YcfA (HicA-like mRNA interferase family)
MTDEFNEEESLMEMPGANMDTRAVHSYLRKRGWELARTKGGHDVYHHVSAKHHIAVPRHRKLKAPLVRGIMKSAEIHAEEVGGMVGTAPANNVGDGNIAGLGVGTQGEPGIKKGKKTLMGFKTFTRRQDK